MAIAIIYRPLVLVMNKNKFLVLSKWTNEKDIGMFGVWTYWKSWVQQGFSFLEKKEIRFIIGPLVSHIFYLKVNWVIPLLRTALRFKKLLKPMSVA